jgi:Nucleotidyl transferase AbiEii toxin, Type IV TA system
MAWPWASPETTRNGLQSRIRSRYPVDEIQLRYYEVAFRRLIARLETADPGRWVIKGGVALLLRLDPNRTSNDIDLAYITAAGRHGLAFVALERAIVIELEDFFSFAIRPFDLTAIEVADDDSLPLRVEASIGRSPWVTFEIDLGVIGPDVPTDALQVGEGLTGLSEVDALPTVTALALPLQLAQKICAMFELHGEAGKHSSRVRDLVDIAMIASQVNGIDARDVRGHLRIEESRRRAKGSLRAPLPNHLELADSQTTDWRRRWKKATRGAPMSFDEAYALARTFLEPILARSGQGRWSSAERAWLENGDTPGPRPAR